MSHIHATFSLRQDARIERQGKTGLVRAQYGGIELDSAFLERLEAGVQADELHCPEGLRLLASGFISTCLWEEGIALAELHPLGAKGGMFPLSFVGDARVQLSRFALLRMKGGRLILECPKGMAQLDLRAPKAGELLFHMGTPHSPEELARLADMREETVRGLLALLDVAYALCCVEQGRDGESCTDEDNDPVFRQWEVHDLYFHTRSRSGRHADGRVQPFRFRDAIAPQPICKPDMPGERILLARPEVDLPHEALLHDRLSEKNEALWEGLRRPFLDIFEQRTSRRTFGEKPLTLEELGYFLFFSARIKKEHPDALGAFSFRPSPSGGALHALELYPLVTACEGLERGLYHYNPQEHYLVRIAHWDSYPEQFQTLLAQTKQIAACPLPHVDIIHTARFQREQYKYASIAYALILKDMGCLHQSMYLVAEALGLAGVALGGGGTELFGEISGLDYFRESPLGSFLLGSRS